ncbi:MAG: ABC transporter ATP-binding protein [Propionivibrio sp.]|jgi:multiple sugar transport system ATP-binding protein|uniref:ABC transporter ATP-binding protein n=1 Tax=Propionivibrio sp. TaxID=2212460 RepID=UPI001B7448F9|nr:ABC transporter ATP-binding protein [Propionivibrio sp.]MBP7204142.1 ABC transporter ATP-binding protein [Propionivibrio sp.]
MARVTIADLCIGYGGANIIEKLDLDVHDGEFLVLLGPSGCGKSTLLHSIAGLVDVSDGRIAIGDKDVTWADPKDRSIGMVFQSYALYPTMNVERNLSFGLRIAGMAKDEIKRRVDFASRLLHLEDYLGRKPSQLSGGQRQRVAIGRALVRDAGVYLFDEPLSNLDAKLRAELRRELKRLHQEIGSTMIYVTHDQIEALTLANRIAVMRGGKIQQVDAPEVIYERPENLFVAGFLGSPSMNFVRGELNCIGGCTTFNASGLTLDLSSYACRETASGSRSVVLGFRPEHVAIAGADERIDFTGRVSVTEPMGDHQIVWIDFNDQSIALTIDKMRDIRLDVPINLMIDTRRISLFDAATEKRL